MKKNYEITENGLLIKSWKVLSSINTCNLLWDEVSFLLIKKKLKEEHWKVKKITDRLDKRIEKSKK